MSEIMYDHSSFLIVGLLFAGLLLSIEFGFRVGRRINHTANEPTRAQIGAIQGSLLGVLALLLGFTFSLSLQRFDARSQAVVTEANAIGTALLRAELLPGVTDGQARDALVRYIDLRIETSKISLDRRDELHAAQASIVALQEALWRMAVAPAREDANPVRSGLFLQALNDVIDAYGERNAALNRHVPEVVLFLLFGTFALTACLVGYSSGVAGHRVAFPTYILILLITFLVFLIIDLDRPRRGLIEVSQQSLLELKASPAPRQSDLVSSTFDYRDQWP